MMFITSCLLLFLPASSSSSFSPRLKDQQNVIEVPFNGKRLITREVLEAVDADNSPEEIKYHLISIVNGEESFIEVEGKRVQSFSQEKVNQQRVLFVHRTRDSRDSIQSSTDASFSSSSSSASRSNRKNEIRTKSPEVQGTQEQDLSDRNEDEVNSETELQPKLSSSSSSSSSRNNNVKVVLSVTDGSSLTSWRL